MLKTFNKVFNNLRPRLQPRPDDTGAGGRKEEEEEEEGHSSKHRREGSIITKR
jgi:hypothetical protein